ncbi:MAG TPA: AMP-binding protein [Burkholderiales bacterium]|nr:AMP-binding protein [Burkholderiales bacterium]
MLLHHFLERTAAQLPGKVALVCEEGPHTYAEVNQRAERLAARLASRGVRRGDRVAIFMPNCTRAVVAIYAALKLGAVFSALNPLTRTEKLGHLLSDLRAACLITHSSLRAVCDGALAQARSVHTCIVADENHADAAATAREDAAIDQDLAAIIYTSGSTGEPKGVMLSHLNMVSAANSVMAYLGYREDDVILCALPLAFSYGLYQVLMAHKVGATVLLERSFTFPKRILEVAAQARATVLPGVPTAFNLLTNLVTPARYDLGCLRIITNAAAALSEEQIRRLRAAFPQATFYSMYGMTECKRVTYLPPEQLDRRPLSVGRGMPNQEHWLVDEAGRRLADGATGELVIRGSHVMRGYWEKPVQSAERLKPGPLAGERVLYSGDIFRSDAEGYLYFVARKDDIIKSRGEKVSPREVENVIYRLPGVLETAVVGVPDAVFGQAVKAFVVLGPGRRYSERDVIGHCGARLESFMVPKYVEFVDGLPKTDNGKIKRQALG